MIPSPNLELAAVETLHLVQYLAAGLAGAPILLVVTARTSLFDNQPSFGEGEVGH